jgi:CheY-like chemotaxis protein
VKNANPVSEGQKALPAPALRQTSATDQLLNAERTARADAERAGRLKDEFLANLSHELRTPINAILGWSQLIKPGESSVPELTEAVEVIQRNARLQAHLIDDLLDMSRVISGKPYAPHLDRVRVLIVDDDADALELVKRVLKSCDAEVTTAGSGAVGLELLQQECPDVVLADIGMPEMDGYEFVKQVRGLELERARNTPVVALTALARSEDRRRAMLAGFDLHVAKPVEPAELVAVVGRLARRV